MEKINPQREDYLTIIFKLMQENHKISNKDISQALDITPPSVTEMLKKLKADGLVRDDKTNFLTEEGTSLAKLVISKHRLWEYFLLNKLNYSWKDVHDIANSLQSATSDDLLNKLNEFLDYPEYCPHGSAIYINNESSYKDFIKMSQAQIQKQYIIRKIRDYRPLLNYCESMGISLGDRIFLKSFDPFDHTVVIEDRKKEIRISPKAARDIFLEVDNAYK